jgi:Tol biopolymer transport system component
VRNTAIGSKLAIATTGLAAALVLVAVASAGGSGSTAGFGRIAVVSEFHSTEVYLADRTGKNLRRVTNNPLGSRWPTLSPDGKRVAFSRKHTGGWSVYVMNVGGGPLFDVTAAAGHRTGLSGYADWSPDGNKIAFSQEFNDAVNILVYDFQLKTTLDVTHNTSANMRPRWSPDGSKIAYSSIAPDGSVDLYTVYADGTNEARLTTQDGWEIEPTWSPDGGRLAYTAYPGGKADVFVMNADGSGVRDVTNDPEADDYQPTWSSTGIAFSSRRNGHQIYVVQPDGRGRKQLTSGNGSLDPRWAQGGRIVFSSSLHARSEIGAVKSFVYRPLTRGPWFDSDPAWSPDGKRLSFTRSARPGKSDIFVADPNGKGQRNLTRGRGINWGAAWSPRANMIAFVRFESFGAQIWAMQPDGTDAHALTTAGSWNEHPSWSPDGRRLVYTARRNGTTDLYVLDLQTLRERRLTRTPEEELDPAWSPDNKWIAFSAPTLGSPSLAILVVRPDGTGRAKVTDGGYHKTKPAWSPDGKRIFYQEELFLGHDLDVGFVTLGAHRTSFWASQLPWSEHSPAWQPRT